MSEHRCQPPTVVGLTVPQRPDWECGRCGRIWRDYFTATGVRWWTEIRGPTRAETA